MNLKMCCLFVSFVARRIGLYMEEVLLVITMVMPEIVGMYIFIYVLLFANVVMIFVAQVL